MSFSEPHILISTLLRALAEERRHHGRARLRKTEHLLVRPSFLLLIARFSKCVFSYRNGEVLGVAFTDVALTRPLHPTFSLGTFQEVAVNYGQAPFKVPSPSIAVLRLPFSPVLSSLLPALLFS